MEIVLIILILIIMPILGSKFKFYQRFEWWDLMTHFVYGFAFAKFGLLIFNLDSIYLAVVSFMFAVTAQTFWEIFEFLCDQYYGTNMQRRKFDKKLQDSQNKDSAIIDTMTDTIAYISGSAITMVLFLM